MLRLLKRSFNRSKKKSAQAVTGKQDEALAIADCSEIPTSKFTSEEQFSLASSAGFSLTDATSTIRTDRRSVSSSNEESQLLNLAVKCQSLPGRIEHVVVSGGVDHNDSGYGVDIAATSGSSGHDDDHDLPSHDVTVNNVENCRSPLRRQFEIASSIDSRSDITITDRLSAVPSKLMRRDKRTSRSLHSFRLRAVLRTRPHCLRPTTTSDSEQPDDEVDGAALRLAAEPLASSAASVTTSSFSTRRRRRGLMSGRSFWRRSFGSGSRTGQTSVADVRSLKEYDAFHTSSATEAGRTSLRSSRSDVATDRSFIDLDLWPDYQHHSSVFVNGGNTGSSYTQKNGPSRSSSPSLASDQTRSLYRRTLSSVINPLGCLNETQGCSPADLASYLREAFQYDTDAHDTLVQQLKNSRLLSNVVVRVTVVGVNDVKLTNPSDNPMLYCCLTLNNSKSPKITPNTSPKTSPTLMRRRSSKSCSTEPSDDNTSQTELAALTNGAATWNEKIALESADLQNEELVVTLYSHNNIVPRLSEPVKRPSMKRNLFRHLRMSFDGSKQCGNLLGYCRLPLSEVPAIGLDKLLPLYRDKKQKPSALGTVHLRIKLAMKSASQQFDRRSASEDRTSIADYYYVVRRLFLHALAVHCQISNQRAAKADFERLPAAVLVILDQFAVHSSIEACSQHLIHLAVFLELKSDEEMGYRISEQLIKDELTAVKHEYEKCMANESPANITISEEEKRILDEAVSLYLRAIIASVKRDKSMPRLFPPPELQLTELEHLIGTATNLLCLPFWSTSHDCSQPRQEFTALFSQHLQENVRRWLQGQFDNLASAESDTIILITRQFIKVLRDTKANLTPIFSISQYFCRLGLDYFKVASIAADSKLSAKAQELMLESDRYQVTHKKFIVNIRESSIVTLEHYFSLRQLFVTIRGNVSERELFRVSMSNYQEWFNAAVMFWLQTFRDECMRRMEKALEIDKDVVQVDSIVKYSKSVVDVLSCFAKMTTEWTDIDFGDADIAVLGVTKITDTICDCVKLYLDKVINILESNGYYDYIVNTQFDVTDQLCITLNNISHVRGYLSELSALLHWDIVTQQLSIKHESEAVGQTALQSLTNLVMVTNDDVTAQSRVLAQQIIEKIADDLKKYTADFTKCRNDLPNDVLPLLNYLETNLQVLYKKLDSTIYPIFVEEIMKEQTKMLLQYMEVGQKPSYYQKILYHFQTIVDYFQSGGVLPESLIDAKLCHKLKDTLEMNSLTSQELMLRYFQLLVRSNMRHNLVQDLYGQLVTKIGYKNEGNGLITIHANVVEARRLPGMSYSDLSCPFVSVELCPLTMFPVTCRHQTKVQPNTVNPSFGEKFSFPEVMNESRTAPGAVIIFSVWHHETLLPNVFLGEVVIPLSDLRELSTHQTFDDLPVIMMPLRRPKEPRDGPYKILKQRMDNDDRIARTLIEQRSRTMEFRKHCRFCQPVKTIVATITGRKLEVIGNRASPQSVSLSQL